MKAHKALRFGIITFTFMFFATLSFLLLKEGKGSSAASTANFKPGNIISDYMMGNYTSMTEKEIQSFLKSKNSCSKALPSSYKNEGNNIYSTTFSEGGRVYYYHAKNGKFVCLADEKFGSGTEYGDTVKNGETAAHIIWQAAQDYKINPQVLIVLLEKEQSLITDQWPNNYQYRAATGYGCPDTAACDSKYYGFKNQVRNAANLFRTVLDGGWTNYPLGKNYIKYNPDASCGGSTVNIENLAASALYRYTPYQPNAAALAAGYGTATCGAYGNRNFYLFFYDWFGDPTINKATSSASKTEPKGVKVSEKVIEDGNYQIALFSNESLVIDILGGVSKTTQNGEIGIWTKKAPTDETIDNQVFNIKYDNKTGYYSIINTYTGLSLDVYNKETNDNTKIIAWPQNNGCNQKWLIEKNSDSSYTILSACSQKAISLKNNTMKQLQPAVIFSNQNQKSQKWKFIAVKKEESSIKNGNYQIISKMSDKLTLDIEGGVSPTTKSGNAIIFNKKTSNMDNQIFTIKKDNSSEYYYIYNPTSNLYLDVYEKGTKDETKVIFWPYNGGCNQKWKIEKTNNGYYEIISACSDKRLDVFGANPAPLTKIIIFRKNGGANQQWKLVKQ